MRDMLAMVDLNSEKVNETCRCHNSASVVVATAVNSCCTSSKLSSEHASERASHDVGMSGACVVRKGWLAYLTIINTWSRSHSK